jgi:hypothetical protein
MKTEASLRLSGGEVRQALSVVAETGVELAEG